MTVSVFIGTSLDGFIARSNGDLDWLPAGGGEPHGYDEFMANIDALVIGRKTFETVLGFKTWPYGEKRVVVLSSHPIDFSAVRGGNVERALKGSGKYCSVEGSAPFSSQQPDPGGACDRYIRDAVPIEVTDYEVSDVVVNRIYHAGLECAVSVSGRHHNATSHES